MERADIVGPPFQYRRRDVDAQGHSDDADVALKKLVLQLTGTGGDEHAAACKERLTLRVRGGKVLGRAEVKLAAGTSRTVRVTLKRADRRKRSLKVTVAFAGASYHRTLQVR